MAIRDPESVKKAWAALPEGPAKRRAGYEIVAALAESSISAALEWAEPVSDDLATSVINVSMASDATTTLDAIMRLPLGSSLKERTIQILSRYRDLNSRRGIDAVLDAAVEALPDDQRRQLSW